MSRIQSAFELVIQRDDDMVDENNRIAKSIRRLSLSLKDDDEDDLPVSASGAQDTTEAVLHTESVTHLSNLMEPAVRTKPLSRPLHTTLAPPQSLPLPPTGPYESHGASVVNPFIDENFLRGLQGAGYLGMPDLSRKKIKYRFNHALAKENFSLHLEAFLAMKNVTKKSEMMIRFLGYQTLAHSPYVHILTDFIPEDESTIRVVLPEAKGEYEGPSRPQYSLWTHLRTVDGTSHWSSKEKGFWPLRVVLAGSKKATVTPNSTTEINRANESKAAVSAVPQVQPTILASVKQLGHAIQKSLPESVQTSLEKLPDTLRTRLGAFAQSFSNNQGTEDLVSRTVNGTGSSNDHLQSTARREQGELRESEERELRKAARRRALKEARLREEEMLDWYEGSRHR